MARAWSGKVYGNITRIEPRAILQASDRRAVDAADLMTKSSDLTRDQAGVQLYAPIPIVFCHRDENADLGGCWISPPASEARFENNAQNAISCWYHLVVSDGQLGTIQSGDVWQGDSQRGNISQSYGARDGLGIWFPANVITQLYRVTTTTRELMVNGAGFSGGATERDAAKASVTLNSEGEYVTSFTMVPVMVAWDKGIVEKPDKSRTITFPYRPARWLPTVIITRDPALNTFRVDETITEEMQPISVSPNVTYKLVITEENTIPLKTPVFSVLCGTPGGTYAGLTTVTFSNTYPTPGQQPLQDWDVAPKQQVHLFIREGDTVPRYGPPTGWDPEGPSSWFPDLYGHLLITTSVIPAELIDADSMQLSSYFCQANGLRFDGVLAQPQSLDAYVKLMAPYFLLIPSQRNGKTGLRPALPYDELYVIAATPVTPLVTLNELSVDLTSLRMRWIPLEDRKPSRTRVIYRQQSPTVPGTEATVEVGYDGEAEDGPYIQHNLSLFCTSYAHAKTFGAYDQARRKHISHIVEVDVLPDADVLELVSGDIIRMNIPRRASIGSASNHSFLYQVGDITEDGRGRRSLALTHFPVDEDSVSLVAQDVLALIA